MPGELPEPGIGSGMRTITPNPRVPGMDYLDNPANDLDATRDPGGRQAGRPVRVAQASMPGVMLDAQPSQSERLDDIYRLAQSDRQSNESLDWLMRQTGGYPPPPAPGQGPGQPPAGEQQPAGPQAPPGEDAAQGGILDSLGDLNWTGAPLIDQATSQAILRDLSKGVIDPKWFAGGPLRAGRSTAAFVDSISEWVRDTIGADPRQFPGLGFRNVGRLRAQEDITPFRDMIPNPGGVMGTPDTVTAGMLQAVAQFGAEFYGLGKFGMKTPAPGIDRLSRQFVRATAAEYLGFEGNEKNLADLMLLGGDNLPEWARVASPAFRNAATEWLANKEGENELVARLKNSLAAGPLNAILPWVMNMGAVARNQRFLTHLTGSENFAEAKELLKQAGMPDETISTIVNYGLGSALREAKIDPNEFMVAMANFHAMRPPRRGGPLHPEPSPPPGDPSAPRPGLPAPGDAAPPTSGQPVPGAGSPPSQELTSLIDRINHGAQSLEGRVGGQGDLTTGDIVDQMQRGPSQAPQAGRAPGAAAQPPQPGDFLGSDNQPLIQQIERQLPPRADYGISDPQLARWMHDNLTRGEWRMPEPVARNEYRPTPRPSDERPANLDMIRLTNEEVDMVMNAIMKRSDWYEAGANSAERKSRLFSNLDPDALERAHNAVSASDAELRRRLGSGNVDAMLDVIMPMVRFSGMPRAGYDDIAKFVRERFGFEGEVQGAASGRNALTHNRPGIAKVYGAMRRYGYTDAQLGKMTDDQVWNSHAAMRAGEKQTEFSRQGITIEPGQAADRRDILREFGADVDAGRVILPEGRPMREVNPRAYTSREAVEQVLEWAGGDRAKAIRALQDEIDNGVLRDIDGNYHTATLAVLKRDEIQGAAGGRLPQSLARAVSGADETLSKHWEKLPEELKQQIELDAEIMPPHVWAERIAGTVFRRSVESGHTARIDDETLDVIKEAVTPLLALAPPGTRVGLLQSAKPIPHSRDATFTYKVIQGPGKGKTWDLTQPWDDLSGDRAFFYGTADFIGIHRFSAPPPAIGHNGGPPIGSWWNVVGGDGGQKFVDSLRGELAHELAHRLLRGVDRDVRTRLLDHAHSPEIQVLDMPLAEYYKAIGREDALHLMPDSPIKTLGDLYEHLYRKSTRREALVQEEAITTMVELNHHGYYFKGELDPIKGDLAKLFGQNFPVRAPGKPDISAAVSQSGLSPHLAVRRGGAEPVKSAATGLSELQKIPTYEEAIQGAIGGRVRDRIIGKYKDLRYRDEEGIIGDGLTQGGERFGRLLAMEDGVRPAGDVAADQAVDGIGGHGGKGTAANDTKKPEQGSVEAWRMARDRDGFIQGAIRAWHGSPHDFDAFDISKIGTGEGAQAFGHGLYFAEKEGVARSYQERLGPQGWDPDVNAIYINGKIAKKSDDIDAAVYLTGNGNDYARAINQVERFKLTPIGDKGLQEFTRQRMSRIADKLRQWRDDGVVVEERRPPPGRLYEVSLDVKPEQLLDWDKALSEQPEAIRKAFERVYADAVKASGYKVPLNPANKASEHYQSLMNALPARERTGGPADNPSLQYPIRYRDEKDASAVLREAGIPGIRYLDQGSRGKGDGTYNYVIFDDARVKIVAKDGKPVSKEEATDVIKGMHAEQDGEIQAAVGGAKQSLMDRIRSLGKDSWGELSVEEKIELGKPDTTGTATDQGGVHTAPERPVAAATRYKGEIFTGVNHGDTIPAALKKYPEAEMDLFGNSRMSEDAGGFITNTGRFVTRKEALALADAAGMSARFRSQGFDSTDLKGTGGDSPVKSGTPEMSELPEGEIQAAAGGNMPPVPPRGGTPPPKPGMVRMYHGGNLPQGQQVDKLWFTSDLRDAQGWAARDTNSMRVWYVDVPRTHKIFDAEYADQTIDQGFTVRNELPAEFANQRQPLIEAAAEAQVSGGGQRPPAPPSGGSPPTPPGNQPPAVPGNFSKAFKFTWNNISTQDDVKGMLGQLMDAHRDELIARGVSGGGRGHVQTWESAEQQAGVLNAVEQLFKIGEQKGITHNSIGMLALKHLYEASAIELGNRIRKANSLSARPGDYVNMHHMITVHRMVQKEFYGGRSEAGRTMQILGKMTGDVRGYENTLRQIIDSTGGMDGNHALAQALAGYLDENNYTRLDQVVAKSTISKGVDAVIEMRTGGLLTGPPTWERNVISNTLAIPLSIIERKVAEYIGSAFHPVDGVQIGEAAAMTQGMMRSWKEAWSALAENWVTGDFQLGKMGPNSTEHHALRPSALGAEAWGLSTPDAWRNHREPASWGPNGRPPQAGANGGPVLDDVVGPHDARRFKALIPGSGLYSQLAAKPTDAFGLAVDMLSQLYGHVSFRPTGAPDAFFKVIHKNMELYALAHRRAMEEVHRGQISDADFEARVTELRQNPPEDIERQAITAAQRNTWTDPNTSDFGKMVARLRTSDDPKTRLAAHILVPFWRTPSRILNATFERTPLAFISGRVQKDLGDGGAAADNALAKIGLGTMVLGIGGSMLLDNWITTDESVGVTGGRADKKPKADTLQRLGTQQFSLRVPTGKEDADGNPAYAFVPLQNLGGVADVFLWGAMLADTRNHMDKLRNRDPENVDRFEIDWERAMAAATLASADLMMNKSSLQGVSELMRSITSRSPETQTRYFDRLTQSMVPASSGLRYVRRVGLDFSGIGGPNIVEGDPVRRQVTGYMDALYDIIPGLSTKLPPALDTWGRPITMESGISAVYDALVPGQARTTTNAQSIDRELVRLDWHPSQPMTVSMLRSDAAAAALDRGPRRSGPGRPRGMDILDSVIGDPSDIGTQESNVVTLSGHPKIQNRLLELRGQTSASQLVRDNEDYLISANRAAVARSLDEYGDKTLLQTLNALVKDPRYLSRDLTDDQRQQTIKDIIRDFETAAKAQTIREFPELQRRRDAMPRPQRQPLPVQ